MGVYNPTGFGFGAPPAGQPPMFSTPALGGDRNPWIPGSPPMFSTPPPLGGGIASPSTGGGGGGLFGGFKPSYMNYGPGWNQGSFMTPQSTQQLAQFLGARGTAQTNVGGPVHPPPEQMLDFGGLSANAGETWNLLQNVSPEMAQRRMQDLMAQGGQGYNALADPSIDKGSYVPTAGGIAPWFTPPSKFGAGAPTSWSPSQLPQTADAGLAAAASSGPNWSPSTAVSVPGDLFGTAPGSTAAYSPGQIFPLPFYGSGQGQGGGATPAGAAAAATPGGAPSGGAQGGTADQFLASMPSGVQYLQGMAANAGYPTDATSAWQAMVAAQQRQIQENAANLNEAFNTSGNRFSTAYGTGMSDFWSQTAKDQNALLGTMTLASQEAARGRELSADQLLANLGFGAGSQLSTQDFQSRMQLLQQMYGASMGMLNAGAGAAGQLQQSSIAGALGLNQNAMTGAGALFGTENQAAMAEIQRQLALQSMMMSGGTSLSNLWQGNLGLGQNLGMGQFGVGQQGISNAYQEWMRQQPQYNPMLSYLYGAATGYPPSVMPGYAPGQGAQYAAAGASGLSGVMMALAMAGMFCDATIKTNIETFKDNGLRLVNRMRVTTFKYRGDDTPHVGVVAQELEEIAPAAVINVGGLKMVNYGTLVPVLVKAVQELSAEVRALKGAL